MTSNVSFICRTILCYTIRTTIPIISLEHVVITLRSFQKYLLYRTFDTRLPTDTQYSSSLHLLSPHKIQYSLSTISNIICKTLDCPKILHPYVRFSLRSLFLPLTSSRLWYFLERQNSSNLKLLIPSDIVTSLL